MYLKFKCVMYVCPAKYYNIIIKREKWQLFFFVFVNTIFLCNFACVTFNISVRTDKGLNYNIICKINNIMMYFKVDDSHHTYFILKNYINKVNALILYRYSINKNIKLLYYTFNIYKRCFITYYNTVYYYQ